MNNVLIDSSEGKDQQASLRSDLVGHMHEDNGLDSSSMIEIIWRRNIMKIKGYLLGMKLLRHQATK